MHKKGNILIVEDDEVACKALDDMLAANGFVVTTVQCALDAIKKLCESAMPKRDPKERINVVIINMMQPELDGDQLIRAIGMHWPEIGTVAMSEENRSRGNFYNFGADSFLAKPLRPENVTHAISNAMQKRSFFNKQDQKQ